MLPWFQYTTIPIGPIHIQVWGLFVALGMALSFFIIWKRSRGMKLNQETMLDLALWMIVGGMIGARLFHVLFYEPSYYLLHPLDIIKIWQGGLSSFGGFAGAIFVFFVFVKKKNISKAMISHIADLFSFSALFGWMVGRIGCFMIHDHLGAYSNCPLAIRTSGGPRLEMALMEILGLIPLAVLFFVMRKKNVREGFFTSVLFLYYGVLRFILDFWRATDILGADARYLGLTPGQYGSIILIIVGIYLAKKIKQGRIA